ncbi:MAG TPA: DsrE/DsrF/DrsH-like family protein [Nocardioides sp.]|uniref:DsrE/DsrF/DrsH-like family protein n=1 Tax=Nocardioides sp. TaxID=35761 RepID=UPI002C7D8FA8|nr:DsrE/DsrF/DrsH-like family protein [Nocardioides sp.]HQR27589.1 DsrE/DsrF/DrsH-like family protein [Nocardioides sp.]
MTTEAAPFVPSFDDDVASDRKLAIICSKGNLDMAYPGLILANAAVGEGIETHLFFTFWGFDMINKETMGDLKFSFVGNTAMHPPGHTGISMHHMLGGLPGATSMATKMLKKSIADLDVPEVPEFLEILSASGCHMWACRMSADMNKLTEDDLYEGVEGIISATDFIELTAGAQMLFI